MNLRIPLKNGASTDAPEIFTDAVTAGKKVVSLAATMSHFKLEADVFERASGETCIPKIPFRLFFQNLARFPQRSLAEHCRRLLAEV